MKTARTAALIGMILGGALAIQVAPAYALPTVGCCQYSHAAVVSDKTGYQFEATFPRTVESLIDATP